MATTETTTALDAYGSTITVGSYVQDISTGREGDEGDVLAIDASGLDIKTTISPTRWIAANTVVCND